MEKKQMFHSLLTDEENILTFVLNQPEWLIAVIVCSVLLLLAMKCITFLECFAIVNIENVFIAQNRKKLTWIWVVVKHQHFSQNKNSEFVTSNTHSKQVATYFFCSAVSQQVIEIKDKAPDEIRYLSNLFVLQSSISNEFYQCSETTHWSDIWNLHFMLNKFKIILLHGKTHFCDFPCHLFYICDLTVVSHNVFRSKPAPAWPYHVCCPSWACLLCRGLTHGDMLWGAPWAQIPSEIHLLRHRHNCDNRCFEMYLLWRGLTHRHSRVSCYCMDSSKSYTPFDSSSHWSSSLPSTETVVTSLPSASLGA